MRRRRHAARPSCPKQRLPTEGTTLECNITSADDEQQDWRNSPSRQSVPCHFGACDQLSLIPSRLIRRSRLATTPCAQYTALPRFDIALTTSLRFCLPSATEDTLGVSSSLSTLRGSSTLPFHTLAAHRQSTTFLGRCLRQGQCDRVLGFVNIPASNGRCLCTRRRGRRCT